MSDYLGKSDVNVELEIGNAIISKSFVQFKITIEQADKVQNIKDF